MRGSAWTMMLITWAIIVFFTGKFFWMVLTPPQKKDKE